MSLVAEGTSRKTFSFDSFKTSFSCDVASDNLVTSKELVVIQEPELSSDEILRTISSHVAFSTSLQTFMLEYLLPTMYKEGGIGIASVQVALPIRAFILDVPHVTQVNGTSVLPADSDPRYVRKALAAGKVIKVIETRPVFEVKPDGEVVKRHIVSERIQGISSESTDALSSNTDLKPTLPPDEEVVIERRPIFIINPSVESLSDETIVIEEGCLSVPYDYIQNTFGPNTRVERPNGLCLKYLDERGEERVLSVDGGSSSGSSNGDSSGSGGVSAEHDKWMVRCALHEFDHLQGVLFTDKLYQGGEALMTS